MPEYDAERATPPAPFASVTIRNPDTRKSVTNVPMLLDTGADVSLIPRIVVEALGVALETADGIRLVAYDGMTSDAVTARVELTFLNKTYRGAFILIEGTHGIIGRDILNLLSLHFDGPQLFWDELPS